MQFARKFTYPALGATGLLAVWMGIRSFRPLGEPPPAPTETAGAHPADGSDEPRPQDGLADLVTGRRHDDSPAGRLVAAAAIGDTRRVEELLAAGADPNVRDANGYGALHQAAADDAPAAVRVLLRAGAEVDSPDGRGWSALSWAAYLGAADSATVLLEADADPNHAAPPDFSRPLDLLMGAWHFGQFAEEGTNRMPSGRAAQRMAIARRLLANGADPNEFRGIPPLELALFSGDEGLVALFLEHGASLQAIPNPRVRRTFMEASGAIGDLVRNAAGVSRDDSSS